MTEAFVKAWLWLSPIAVGVGAFAIYLAPRKRVWPFAVTVLGVFLIAGFALAATDSTSTSLVYSFLLAIGALAPMAAAYALILGGMVRNAARSDSIAYSTLAIHVVAVPISVFLALYLTCYFGHDCL